MEEVAGESNMCFAGLARRLASPKKKIRDRTITVLVLWLSSQKQLEEDELKKIWKGLFYCVWHSDKALVQADLIEKLASIFEKLEIELALQFFKVFLMTMRREWAGIDRLRLDKFYILLRKCLAHMLSALQTSGWYADSIKEFMDVLLENAFLAKDKYAAMGINLHYADIFLEELKNFLPLRVSTFKLLLEPFLDVCAQMSDKSLLQRIKENIFEHLFDLGRAVITAKKDENPLDSVSEMLGSLFLSLPLGETAFVLASTCSTSLTSRKILYELQMEYEKMEKLLSASGIVLSLPTGGSGKKRKKNKQKKNKGLVPSIEKPTKRKALHKKVACASKKKFRNSPDGNIVADNAACRSKEDEETIKSDVREESECDKDLVSESKDQVATGNEQKKGASTVKRKKKHASAGTRINEKGFQNVSNGLGVDGSVVMKLEREFDMLADNKLTESNENLTPSMETSKVISPQSTGKKKRKRSTSTDGIAVHPELAGGKDTTPIPGVEAGNSNSSGKVKRVRFALKKNLVWTPSTPLPDESVRVPPSATPRGSALKKGVPPGPIVSEAATTLKQRRGTPMRPSGYGRVLENTRNTLQSRRPRSSLNGKLLYDFLSPEVFHELLRLEFDN